MKMFNYAIIVLTLSSISESANAWEHWPHYHRDHVLVDPFPPVVVDPFPRVEVVPPIVVEHEPRYMWDEPVIVDGPLIYDENPHQEIRRLENRIEDLRVERDLHPNHTIRIDEHIRMLEARIRYIRNNYF